ncbi:MAG TPA: FAD-dependent oxidoreductase, partial [Terriglobales bacterium]|nr:FAD-dependent oxidoreductase [Terriglobales bacterium]
MRTGSYDVAIIGGGIVGAACAAEFARERMRVVVIESSVIGGDATAAGMGHIVVMDDSEAQFALTRYSQLLWREIREELPTDVEFESCGTIWVAADDDEMREVRRKESYYGTRGVPTQVLDPAALHQAEPNLREGLAGGLLVPEDAVLYPPCAAGFLMRRAQSGGAKVHVGRAVAIEADGVRLEGGAKIVAGITVNAGGASSPTLSPGLDVKKRKGHLVITDRYPGYVRHQLVELGYLKSAHSMTSESVAFNVQPRSTGQLLIGSSRQYGAEHREVDPGIVKQMLARALEYMPGLGQLAAIRTWTGFRAATPDKLPVIGPSSSQPGLFLTTGHEGLGITTSLGTAKLLVDQVLNRRSAIPFEPYLPTRVEESAHAH